MKTNFRYEVNVIKKEKYFMAIFLSSILLFASITTASTWIPNIYAQQQGQLKTAPTTTTTTTTSNNQTAVGTGDNQLKFSIKLNQNSQAAQQQPSPENSKNVTVNVNVQQGPGGKSIKLPVTAMVPQSTQPQDLQLCISIGLNEQCQPLSNNQSAFDLTKTQQGQGQLDNSILI
jgi:hypothetical protein